MNQYQERHTTKQCGTVSKPTFITSFHSTIKTISYAVSNSEQYTILLQILKAGLSQIRKTSFGNGYLDNVIKTTRNVKAKLVIVPSVE